MRCGCLIHILFITSHLSSFIRAYSFCSSISALRLTSISSQQRILSRRNDRSLVRMSGGGLSSQNIYTVLGSSPASLQSLIKTERGSTWTEGLKSLLIFSLGFEVFDFKALSQEASAKGASVFVTTTYGIVGYSPEENRNLELLEKGRGQEYGCVGGDGGSGVVAALFYGDDFISSTDSLPKQASSHMVVCTDTEKVISVLEQYGTSFYYGGVAKKIHTFNSADQSFVGIPHFVLSSLAGPVSCGAVSVTGDVKPAVTKLLSSLPASSQVSSVAMFPCFTRGKNKYGVNDIEPSALSELLPSARLFGMFAHGELGPNAPKKFGEQANPKGDCGEHSETTILTLFASPV